MCALFQFGNLQDKIQGMSSREMTKIKLLTTSNIQGKGYILRKCRYIGWNKWNTCRPSAQSSVGEHCWATLEQWKATMSITKHLEPSCAQYNFISCPITCCCHGEPIPHAKDGTIHGHYIWWKWALLEPLFEGLLGTWHVDLWPDTEAWAWRSWMVHEDVTSTSKETECWRYTRPQWFSKHQCWYVKGYVQDHVIRVILYRFRRTSFNSTRQNGI